MLPSSEHRLPQLVTVPVVRYVTDLLMQETARFAWSFLAGGQ